MKRSTNFNGRAVYRKLGANDLVETLRFLGMTDEEIKDAMLKKQQQKKCTCWPGQVSDIHMQSCPMFGADIAKPEG